MKGYRILHAIPIAVVVLAIILSPPIERFGLALYYGPTAMQTVMANRGLPPYPCMLASPYHDIGAVVDVTGLRTGHTRRCKVYDVPKTIHRPGLAARHVVAELDNRSARSICGETNEQPPKPRNCWVRVRDVVLQVLHKSAGGAGAYQVRGARFL